VSHLEGASVTPRRRESPRASPAHHHVPAPVELMFPGVEAAESFFRARMTSDA
jgi:hypothetical protein